MTFVNVKPARRTRRRPSIFADFDRMFDELAKGDVTVKHRPAANVLENEDGFKVELATPGLSKKDLTIKVENEVLTISADIKAEASDGEKAHRREFNYNNFTRTFQLPDTVDATGIKANYKNGILTLSIPKKEEAKPLPARTIEIK